MESQEPPRGHVGLLGEHERYVDPLDQLQTRFQPLSSLSEPHLSWA